MSLKTEAQIRREIEERENRFQSARRRWGEMSSRARKFYVLVTILTFISLIYTVLTYGTEGVMQGLSYIVLIFSSSIASVKTAELFTISSARKQLYKREEYHHS